MKIGEQILEEEPFCHVLLQKWKGKRCDRCFITGDDLKKCTGCSNMFYCNKICQKRDWTLHKKECKCLKSVSPKIPMDSVRLLLRLVLCEQLGLPQNSPWSRTLNDMESHVEEIKLDDVRSEELAKMCYTLSTYAGSNVPMPAPSHVAILFGKMLINALTICDGELNDIGTGIYLSGSRLDHSCCPNAVASFQGATLVVTATQDIADPSPEKVFISYIDQLASWSERQAALKKQYYFDCHCDRCNDKEVNEMMVSFCCPQTNCVGAVGLRDEGVEFSACNKCGTKDFPKNLRQGALQILKEVKTDIKKLNKEKSSSESKLVLSQCKGILKKSAGILHDNNIYVVRVLDRAMDSALACEEFELAVKYGRRSLTAYRLYYPSNSPNLGLQLFRVGKLELYLQELDSACQALRQAQDVLAVTHGSGSELHKEVTLFLNQCLEEQRANLEKSKS